MTLGSAIIGMFIALLGAVQPAWAATRSSDQNIVNAFTVWIATGKVQPTGADRAKLEGTIGGHLYVDTDQGPIVAGIVSCPVILEINLTDKSQQGDGKCTITADDGAQVFGQLKCTGFFLIGCSGDFNLTGGTGRFDGIVGSGPVMLRANTRILIEDAKGKLDAAAEGIMFWRRLHYTLPRKAAS
jgi:hypothetical protein